MDAMTNVTPRLTQRAMSTVGLFAIVGTPLPILKSILAKAVIYPIGVPTESYLIAEQSGCRCAHHACKR